MVKNISLLLFLLTISARTEGVFLDSVNTIIISDLDDVLVQKTYFHDVNIYINGIWANPWNALTYCNALNYLNKKYPRAANGLKKMPCDSEGNAINGVTFHYLHHGMQDERLAPYVEGIVRTKENSRCYIEGTRKIYKYLKEKKGYTIMLATNKDRVAYDMAEQAFGSDFADLISKSFVAHPANSPAYLEQLKAYVEQSLVSVNYRNFLYRVLTIQSSDSICHVPCKKPELLYYQKLHETIGFKKNIIFIDDKQKNIEGFYLLQDYTDAYLHGIQFKDPIQLVDEFVRLGILSEDVDRELLDSIRCVGFTNSIVILGQKFRDALRIPIRL